MTALLGWIPRIAAPVGWGLIGFAGVMATFGGLLELPEALTDLNPYGHLSEYPVEEIAWTPVVVLCGIGILGVALGLVGWNRREVNRV